MNEHPKHAINVKRRGMEEKNIYGNDMCLTACQTSSLMAVSRTGVTLDV